MIYLEYEEARRKYRKAQVRYNSLVDKAEELFNRTQPGAIRYDTDRVQSSPDGDVILDYILTKEREHIDERIATARYLLDKRKEALDIKENELRHSRALIDVVYVYRYLEGIKAYQIAARTHYSEAHINNLICRINKVKKSSKPMLQ